MKNLIYHTVVGLLLALCATGLAAPMDVMVVDANNRLAHKGRLDADGSFSTRPLRPGDYVVQFNARGGAPREDYAIIVGAGRNKVVADTVAGEKFAGGGVAMRIKVPRPTRIVGHVAAGGAEAIGVRIINGRRYILVRESTGTFIGPRWVEEGTQSVRNVFQISRDDVRELQDKGTAQNR